MFASSHLQNELAHVYWIGGSPCSGKSSITNALGQRHPFHLYRCDEAFYQHEKLINPDKQPAFSKISHYTWEELWMRPVDLLLSEEFAVYREEFQFILEDLMGLSKDQPILAEGAALLPECIAPLLAQQNHAIWVVPSEEFQLCHYSQREWARDIVKTCSDPEQAFQNWMQRDISFGRCIRAEAENRGLRVLVVDGEKTIDDNISQVEQHFQLA